MILGVPRGSFYYDYHEFICKLFRGSNIDIMWGSENDEDILKTGSGIVVDEACMPVKLMAGQIAILESKCDMIIIPRMMKDIRGKWLCPKLLGLPELMSSFQNTDKLLITPPMYFNNKKKFKKALREVCAKAGMCSENFEKNFEAAYSYQQKVSSGEKNAHVETAWEFVPQIPTAGEIILPNTSKIFLAGHCYNVYDKFANDNIMARLDELCIEAVTENAVSQPQKEMAVKQLGLIKTPFWESLIRNLGAALCLQHQVDGMIYLSSFSCGPDAVIIELIRKYVPELPMMVIKLDEHKGTAGLETRLEAFADLIDRRKVS